MGEEEGINEIDFDIVKKIVSDVIQLKGGKYGLTKKAIHKLCFVLKNKLSAKNILKNYLPFYWYKYGPFSEVIQIALNEAIDEGMIEKIDIDGVEVFKAKNILVKETDIPWKEAYKVLSDIDFNPFKTEEFTLFVYREFAPRKFRYFSQVSKIYLSNYIEEIERRGKAENIKKEIILTILKTEANLPREEIFEPFNPIFSSYVTSLIRFMKHENSLEPEEKIVHADEIRKTLDNLQELFGEGERIIEHDSYYNKKIKKWERQYHQHIKLYDGIIENLGEHIINDVIGIDKLSSEYTAVDKEILSMVFPEYYA